MWLWIWMWTTVPQCCVRIPLFVKRLAATSINHHLSSIKIENVFQVERFYVFDSVFLCFDCVSVCIFLSKLGGDVRVFPPSTTLCAVWLANPSPPNCKRVVFVCLFCAMCIYLIVFCLIFVLWCDVIFLFQPLFVLRGLPTPLRPTVKGSDKEAASVTLCHSATALTPYWDSTCLPAWTDRRAG